MVGCTSDQSVMKSKQHGLPIINMRKSIKGLSLTFDRVPVFAGQVLRGTLNFSLRDCANVKSIILNFEGSSKTSSGSDRMPKDGKEQWLFRVQVPCLTYLFQSSVNCAGKYKLDAGEHEIPFAIPLPAHVPSAFGGKYGYVYYCCRAVIVTTATLGSAEFRTERAIPLIGIEDLNWHRHTLLPVTLRHSYMKRTLCVKHYDVNIVLSLKKTAFIPGEDILLNGEIQNRHRTKRVKRAAIELMQTVYYQVDDDKQRCTRNVVANLTRVDMFPGALELYEDSPLRVPGCVSSFMRHADYINCQYELLVTIDASVRLRCPIIIGTVPFRQDTQKPAVPIQWQGTIKMKDTNNMPFGPQFTPQMQMPTGPPPFVPRMPPPYHQAMRHRHNHYVDDTDIGVDPNDGHVLTIEEIE